MLPRATVDDEWTRFDIQLCQPAGSSLATVSGRNPGTGLFPLTSVQMWPVHEIGTFLSISAVSLYRGLPRGSKSGERRTHTSFLRQKTSILPQIEVFLFPRVLPPDLKTPSQLFNPNFVTYRSQPIPHLLLEIFFSLIISSSSPLFPT